jgi:hypothetical protein
MVAQGFRLLALREELRELAVMSAERYSPMTRDLSPMT